MQKKTFVPFVAASLAIALVSLIGCNRSSQQAGFTMPPAAVVIAPVVTADVPVYLDEIGKTTAKEVVTVQPQISGKLQQRFFADGADVKAGQELFSIDPRPFQAALDAAQAMLEQNKAQLDNAKVNFDRVSSLLASKAVAQQDYDNDKNAVAVADASVKAAQAQVETARLNLDYCTITSPIDGRVGLALVDPGNIVTANSSNLLIVQKVTPIYADFTVPETELDRVRQNMSKGTLQVLVHTQDDPKPPAQGDLQSMDNSIQDGTGTIKLRAQLENQDRRFWPGQFVQVRLILSMAHDAVLVPNEAVQVGQQGAYVFVLKPDGTAEQRQITPGQRQGDQTVVEQGLSSGETVIRTGQMMIIPGLPVMVTNPAATQPASASADAGSSAGAKP